VTGRFAETASRDALQVAISDLAGERPVRIEADILNSSLCLIDAAFNKSKSGGFDVRLGFGKRLGENSTGIYIVGDNPVIDVAMPELIQSGYLYVSVVDVKGVVFHMLPNRTRRDNAIETLKSEAKDGFVRVAYSISEATENGRLAFTVDDSVLGKSRVIVLYSDQPLFGELRPTSESTESYVEALEAVSVKGELSVRSVDTGLITTKR
jgi:serine/threonine-protein kinase